MRDLSGGPRVLLRRLRELMAEPLEPQERLDRIVRQIAGILPAAIRILGQTFFHYPIQGRRHLGGGHRGRLVP